MKKRASYRHGVEIIALNDEPTWLALSDVANMISVGLLAELFGCDPWAVAKDVIAYRCKHDGVKP